MEKIKEALRAGEILAGKTLENPERDESELQEWSRSLPEGEEFVRSFSSPNTLRNKLLTFSRIDVERGLDGFIRKVKRQRRKRVLKWVSSSAAIFLLGVGIFSLWSDKNTEMTDRKPDNWEYLKAFLVREDGNCIDLSHPVTLAAKGAKVSNEEVGVLKYQKKGGANNNEINTLIIPKRGEYQLVLSDQTKVWLNTCTELVYPVIFNEKERRVKLKGEAFFEVAKSTVPFIVNLGGMDIRVLGTSFNIMSYEDDAIAQVTLNNGSIRIEIDTVNHQLKPGDQLILDKVSGTVEIKQVIPDYYSSWRNGEFIFNDETLESVARKLSRWYGMPFIIRSESIRNLKFTGSLERYDSVEEVCRILARSGGLDVIYSDVVEIIAKDI